MRDDRFTISVTIIAPQDSKGSLRFRDVLRLTFTKYSRPILRVIHDSIHDAVCQSDPRHAAYQVVRLPCSLYSVPSLSLSIQGKH